MDKVIAIIVAVVAGIISLMSGIIHHDRKKISKMEQIIDGKDAEIELHHEKDKIEKATAEQIKDKHQEATRKEDEHRSSSPDKAKADLLAWMEAWNKGGKHEDD